MRFEKHYFEFLDLERHPTQPNFMFYCGSGSFFHFVKDYYYVRQKRISSLASSVRYKLYTYCH